MTDRVDELVDLLGCSIREAEQLIADDKLVDRMTVKECESDLTAEQKAAVKKAKQVGRAVEPKAKKPFVPNLKAPTERAKNLTKIGIVAELYRFISENLTETAEITNESKIIEFSYGGKQYKLDLVERRKPKA
jgi:hypothetical protein